MQRLLMVITFLLLPHLLLADEFSEFRIPRHQVLTARTSLVGAYSGRQNTSGYTGHSSTDGYRDLRGALHGTGYWLYDSDPLRFETELGGAVGGRNYMRRVTTAMLNVVDNDYHVERQRDLLEQFRLSTAARLYPWALPLGFEINADLSGVDGQRWSSGYSRMTEPTYATRQYNDTEVWGYSYYSSGRAALGVGRVRNATVVYDVAALEQRLRERGIITRELLPATRKRLIDLFYVRGDYSRVHERSARFFWREIETALAEDGGLRVEGLDAYSLYRIAEGQFGRYQFGQALPPGGYWPAEFFQNSLSSPYLITFSGPSRQTGWFVGPTVGASHNHTVRLDHYRESRLITNEGSSPLETHSDSSYHYDRASDQVTLGLRGEYHRPLGLRWQVDAQSEVTHPYDDRRNIKRESFRFASSASVTRFILDRWLLSAGIQHNRELRITRSFAGVWSSEGSWAVSPWTQLDYYVEDRLSVSLTARYAQTHYRHVADIARHGTTDYRRGGFDRSCDVLLGFTYQLAGNLRAPGIATPSSIDSD